MEASGHRQHEARVERGVTIGTLDRANIEIRERVGNDNIFIFGLTAEEVVERRRRGPGARETVARLPVLQECWTRSPMACSRRTSRAVS